MYVYIYNYHGVVSKRYSFLPNPRTLPAIMNKKFTEDYK